MLITMCVIKIIAHIGPSVDMSFNTKKNLHSTVVLIFRLPKNITPKKPTL